MSLLSMNPKSGRAWLAKTLPGLLLLAWYVAGCDDAGVVDEPDTGCYWSEDCPTGMLCDRTTGLCTRVQPDVVETSDGLDSEDADDDALELTDDGLDEEADDGGLEPETTRCEPGQRSVCRASVIQCVTGARACVNGVWGPCEDSEPYDEVCDGYDNDCNGSVDDGLFRECGIGVGLCALGVQSCASGAWGPCKGDLYPTAEACDGFDNDCDGETDEGLAIPCGTSEVGACMHGVMTCVSGAWSICTDAVEPSEDVCDGLDNNCDGMVDNGAPRRCGTDEGACVHGNQPCVNGRWGACIGATGPQPEVCDGLDNDCDGEVDENLTTVCGVSNISPCKFGVSTCVAGTWGACEGAIDPSPEVCDGEDNDCDRLVDDRLGRLCGSTEQGECTLGTELCVQGVWTGCTAVEPTTEVCSLAGEPVKDEDCDGQADEGCNCTFGETRPCGVSSTAPCQLGTQTCIDDGGGNNVWGPCSGNIDPTPEACDGADNDCDGTVDGMLRVCGSTSVGACSFGHETCVGGSWAGCTALEPGVETCDGYFDEDCDGQRDEGCQCVNGRLRSCGTNVGECVAGRETCADGVWGPCIGRVGPQAEVCDRKDNDCDSIVDNVAVGTCNEPPVAVCPADRVATPLDTLSFSGTASWDPDGDTLSYLWTVVSRPTGSTSNPTPATWRSPSFFVDLAGDYTLQLTVSDGRESSACQFHVTATPSQALHVELVWEENNGDLDLHLTRANEPALGALFHTSAGGAGKDCWWRNHPTQWGASLDIDDTNGFGPENINIVSNVTAGTYTVAVHTYCGRGLDSTGFVGINGPHDARVRIYCGGSLAAVLPGPATWTTLPGQGDLWLVAEVEWTGVSGAACVVTPLGELVSGIPFCVASGRCGTGSLTTTCLDTLECGSDADCSDITNCGSIVVEGQNERHCLLNEVCASDVDCTNAARPTCNQQHGICAR